MEGAALVRGPEDALELLDKRDTPHRMTGALKANRLEPRLKATLEQVGAGRHPCQADGRKRRRWRGTAHPERAGADGTAYTRGRRPVRAESEPRGWCASIIGAHADVAQLARASPCHGEGRGFESLHPLSAVCRDRRLRRARRADRSWAAILQSAPRRAPGPRRDGILPGDAQQPCLHACLDARCQTDVAYGDGQAERPGLRLSAGG